MTDDRNTLSLSTRLVQAAIRLRSGPLSMADSHALSLLLEEAAEDLEILERVRAWFERSLERGTR